MFDISKLYQDYSSLKAIGIKDPLVKMLIELSNNKKNGEEDLFIVEGLWAYEKLIKGNVKIKAFVFCPEFIKSALMVSMVNSIVDLAEKTYLISPKICERLSSQDHSEGFFLLCRLPVYKMRDIRLNCNNLLVVLDGLEQAGNIGTIIRSVDGAGGDAVVLCNSKVRRNNSKLIKATMGACFTIPVIQADKNEIIQWLLEQNFRIVLTELTAQKSYFDIDYSGRVAIVAGNEIHGVSMQWHSQPCEKVIIPMLGGVDSLNVGIETTLVTYEASMRQKGFIKRSS
jgi:TrmH family RNA methyltransferase